MTNKVFSRSHGISKHSRGLLRILPNLGFKISVLGIWKFLKIFLLTLIIFVLFNLIKIKKVECKSQFSKCSPVIINDLAYIHDQNIVKTYREVKNTIDDHILINSYYIHFDLNRSLIVYVNERAPKYCLNGENKTYYFDDNLIVLKISEESGEKCVNDPISSYEVGDHLGKNDEFAHSLFLRLANLSHIGNIKYETDYLTVEYYEGIKLLFPLEGNSEILAARVYYVVTQFDKIKRGLLEDDISEISEIDFRYDGPVLRYQV